MFIHLWYAFILFLGSAYTEHGTISGLLFGCAVGAVINAVFTYLAEK